LFALAILILGCQRGEKISGANFNEPEWERRLKNPHLTETEFTRLFAEAVAAATNASVRITGLREVTVKTANGTELKSFLDNAWAEAAVDAPQRPEICRRYIASLMTSARVLDGPAGLPITNSIVPLVRDESLLSGMRDLGQVGTNQVVSELLAADLRVFYASDREGGFAFLTEGDRKALGLEMSVLRSLAMGNLRRIMPEVKHNGSGPLFMFDAGGNYEASLLLSDKLWDGEARELKGEIVAAVPSRDVLVYTTSSSVAGLAALRQAVDKVQAGGDHLVSKTLLIRRNGRWEKFTD
jgi:hypothetical protein